MNKAYSFACNVIIFARDIPSDCKVLAHQLVRSGTSIGASVTEAQGTESKLDFVHKLKIADKEAKETEYWLDLLRKAGRGGDQVELRNELSEIQRLLNSIISTCKRSLKAH